MKKEKKSKFLYAVTKLVAKVYARIFFKPKLLRNEIKGAKGPFVIIANHQAAFDFVNLIGATKRQMTFVVSESFYNTLPIKWIMRRIGVIPKQQFQTGVHDLKRMKSVIEDGGILVIYPAGLMCEDGKSTPIPDATYKFLKWLGVDVYMAKISGTYFVSPKWSKRKRPGKTTMDIYKLIAKEALYGMEETEVRRIAESQLHFDAYREQEERLVRYHRGDNLEGLHNVLYVCPHCRREFTVSTDKNRIFCTACDYEERGDKYGFLHKFGEVGEEIRYVSDWSAMIYEHEKELLKRGDAKPLGFSAKVQTIDYDKHKFVDITDGSVTLGGESFIIKMEGREPIEVPIASFVSLPFKPGICVEVQKGHDIYRLLPEDGRLSMKIVNTVKALYELRSRVHVHKPEN